MSTSKSSSAALSWRDRGLICLAGVQALQSVAAATKAVMRAMVAGELKRGLEQCARARGCTWLLDAALSRA
mgnify:CR=1 FL=1